MLLSEKSLSQQCNLKAFCHINSFRGCSYEGELARLGGLARLGEMIFIPRSYGIFYLSSIKKFVKLRKFELNRLFDQIVFTINRDVKPSYWTNALILFN